MWSLVDSISQIVLYRCQGLATGFRVANLTDPGPLNYIIITFWALYLIIIGKNTIYQTHFIHYY